MQLAIAGFLLCPTRILLELTVAIRVSPLFNQMRTEGDPTSCPHLRTIIMPGEAAETEVVLGTDSAGAPAPDPRTHMAAMRTMLAMDRTLLAWVRTALSLIAGGVAFDKGARLLHEARLREGTALVETSHAVGLAVTATSTALVGLATWAYLRNLRTLAKVFQNRPSRLQSSVIAAILVMIFGVLVIALLIATDK